MKLWLDDQRSPPNDDWTWVRTVEEAKQKLSEGNVTEQSLDHDLGEGQADGHTLVVWEYDHDLVPYVTTIHSWNLKGALRMQTFLQQHKRTVVVQSDPRPPGGAK